MRAATMNTGTISSTKRGTLCSGTSSPSGTIRAIRRLANAVTVR